MASQSVCQFNKFGFCKFKEACRKQHVKELCENQAPRKLAQGFTTGTGGDGRVRLPR